MTPKESFEPLNRRTARSIRALQAGKALKLKKHDVLVTSFFNFQCRRRASRKISICRIGLGDYRFEVKKSMGLVRKSNAPRFRWPESSLRFAKSRAIRPSVYPDTVDIVRMDRHGRACARRQ